MEGRLECLSGGGAIGAPVIGPGLIRPATQIQHFMCVVMVGGTAGRSNSGWYCVVMVGGTAGHMHVPMPTGGVW